MLTYKHHVETAALKCKKGLSVLKAMAAKGIEQRHLFLLYQSVVLSVIDYGLGLTTMPQTNLLKLDRVQNEAMRVILGTTKDTPTETMRFMLDLPPMQTRQKVEQVKAYFSGVENPHNPLHDAVKDTKGSRLGQGFGMRFFKVQVTGPLPKRGEQTRVRRENPQQQAPKLVPHIRGKNSLSQPGIKPSPSNISNKFAWSECIGSNVGSVSV